MSGLFPAALLFLSSHDPERPLPAERYTGSVMRRAVLCCLAALWTFAAHSAPAAGDDVLERLGPEADRFAEAAPRWIASEILRQIVQGTETHVVRSEYGFVSLPSGMREIRRVVSVDGRKVKQSKKLDSLALALASDDDTARRKLLESFEKHRLHGIATDFGQLILLFAHGNQQKFEFSRPQAVVAGQQHYFVLRFQQLDGSEALTIFEGGTPVKQKMRGEVWIRASDRLPVRIALDSEHHDGDDQVRDVGAVDYRPSASGVLLPAAVLHRQFRNGRLQVQDHFQYTDYREIAPASKP